MYVECVKIYVESVKKYVEGVKMNAKFLGVNFLEKVELDVWPWRLTLKVDLELDRYFIGTFGLKLYTTNNFNSLPQGSD